jgi:hypothetical protein
MKIYNNNFKITNEEFDKNVNDIESKLIFRDEEMRKNQY